MEILVCFGTRPEAIKMAPVILELRKRGMNHKVCVTAQHREMLDQVLQFFDIIPDFDLNLMEENQSLNRLSGRILIAFDEVLERGKPDVVLVHGDTSSSAMLALASFHRGIKVGHVEAGLRTYNRAAPFPEEINRQITARLADYHFAPTTAAKENLLQEKLTSENIFLTGNTVVDALLRATEKMRHLPKTSEIRNIENQLNPSKKKILVTGHRRENFGRGMEELCHALIELSALGNLEIIYPLHPNPNVRTPVLQLLQDKIGIFLIPPVEYPTILWLMQEASFIISDSGGIQEEAPAFGKQVLVTREFSERMEGVEAGFSILAGTDREKIVFEAKRILSGAPLERENNPYGDGKAAERIVDVLMSFGC